MYDALTGAAFSEDIHGRVAEHDLGAIHGTRQYRHDDGHQLQNVPELNELAPLLANLVDDVHEEVDDKPDKDHLSIKQARDRIDAPDWLTFSITDYRLLTHTGYEQGSRVVAR